MNNPLNQQNERPLQAPEYDEAWFQVLHQATQGLVFQDSVFGSLRRVKTSHCGPIRNVRLLDQPYTGTQFSATMHEDELRQTNVDQHTIFVCEMAEATKRELGPKLFQSIAEMTAASDMDFDTGEQPLSVEMLLKTLEKLVPRGVNPPRVSVRRTVSRRLPR